MAATNKRCYKRWGDTTMIIPTWIWIAAGITYFIGLIIFYVKAEEKRAGWVKGGHWLGVILTLLIWPVSMIFLSIEKLLNNRWKKKAADKEYREDVKQYLSRAVSILNPMERQQNRLVLLCEEIKAKLEKKK